MSHLHQALASSFAAEEHFRNADMMRTYQRVTAEHGPSQALLDFINHDKSYGAEIGLESFESFSTQVQHEIMLSKMDPDAVDMLGLESLSASINKASNWLIGLGTGGVFGAVVALGKNQANYKTKLIIGGISYGALISGLIMKKVNVAINGVFPQPAFVKVQKAFAASFKEESHLLATLPDDFEVADWENYKSNYLSNHSETSDNWDAAYDAIWDMFSVEKVLPEKSAWTEKTFAAAGKWLVDTIEVVHTEELKFAKKLERIKKFVSDVEATPTPEGKKVTKLIRFALGKRMEILRDTRSVIEAAAKELNAVGKMFEVEK